MYTVFSTHFSSTLTTPSCLRYDEEYSASGDENDTPSSFMSSGMSDAGLSYDDDTEIHERSSLLPPSGISTGEDHHGGKRGGRLMLSSSSGRPSTTAGGGGGGGGRDRSRLDKRGRYHYGEDFNRHNQYNISSSKVQTNRDRRHKTKGKQSRTKAHNHHRQSYKYGDGYDSYDSDDEKYRMQEFFTRERQKWYEEWRQEEKARREEEERNRWYNRFFRYLKGTKDKFVNKTTGIMSDIESFISNLPLTIGAVALAIVTLGVVWFKFAEENLDSCQPVHFHSEQCTYPEFPGCFYCDTDASMYKVALGFHFACSILAGILAMLFFAKIFLARRVVIDEMCSPTTSSPAGLICMTMVCVFAGRGLIGQTLVTAAAGLHFCLAILFICMALAYNIMPDPSWYPNTVGIGLSAVKTWLYYPIPGHLLMAVSMISPFHLPLKIILCLDVSKFGFILHTKTLLFKLFCLLSVEALNWSSANVSSSQAS